MQGLAKRRRSAFIAILSATLQAAVAPSAPPQAAARGGPPNGDIGATSYADHCSGCHGTGGAGARGPDLFDARLLALRTDPQLHEIVANGIAGSEMPPFKGVLTDGEMAQIIAYLRARAAKPGGMAAAAPDPSGQVIRSARQAFRIDVVVRGLSTPWGLAWLPDGRMLVTERPGRLRIVDRRMRLLPDPVRNTPRVWERQDAGMLDVAVHPDYARTGWIYLSYTDVAQGHVVTPDEQAGTRAGDRAKSPPSMTVIVRGRISKAGAWIDNQELFRAPTALYTDTGSHYGSRFLFDGHGHLFFTLGERGDMTNAQRLDTPLGKIHRINDDGTVPADNPFVHTPGAVPTIWSYGHRNPEGLAYDPATGLLWESEHGPAGGDELNIIEKGHDYGWGVVTMGVQPGIAKREEAGMDPPIAYWTPAIAPSGISFYTGARYPGWRGSLFVAGLAGQQLRRIEVEGRRVLSQEVLFAHLGRTRAVRTGPDGRLYVLLQNATGAGTGIGLSEATPGMVIRLEPVT